jgi:nucleoporin POM152
MPIKDSSLTQIIHPHSSAKFILEGQNRFIKCMGDKMELQVQVQGSGPWEVVYEITHGLKSKKFVRKVSEKESRFEFSVDDLEISGIYTVDLVEIKDGNGCSLKLSSDVVKIEVLPARPSISFQSVKNIYTLEGGKAMLPVSLSGRGPFEIQYRNMETQQTFTTHVQGSTRSFEVQGPGIYELISIKDSFCVGNVDDSKKIRVLTIAKPTIKIQSYESDTVEEQIIHKPDSCVGVENGFQIDLTGKAPFKVKYSHKVFASGSRSPIKSETLTESVDTLFVRILFDSSIAGLHKYELEGFSDGNYKQPVTIPGPKVVEQVVFDSPSASFLDPEQKIFQCTSRSKNPFQLGLKLAGTPPFIIKIEQRHDNQHVQWIEKTFAKQDLTVEDGGYEVSFVADSVSTMGRHDFILESISDANACPSKYDRSTNPINTFVEIADQARITPYTKDTVCVGDLLSYTLQGTPPFTIGYTWQGVVQSDLIVPDPMMSFWAGVEGDIVITKVCNSAGCCDESVATDERMKTTVKPLPKAIVDQGLDLIDDIREGTIV